MSSRARRLGGSAAAEAFAWAVWENGAPWPDAMESAALLIDAAGGPDEGTDERRAAEQRDRLAALEREAFAKGYEQGERAGLEAGGKRAEAMLRRVAQTLEDLATLRESLIRQTERQVVQLALVIARRIVQREVSLDEEFIAALTHVALDRLGHRAGATVRLHPEDYTVVMAGRGETWNGSEGPVTVVPDVSVSRGGCVVESELGFIDASLDAQFQEMARAVLGDTDEPTPLLEAS